ncbi:MAG: ABC transporter permease [Anaerolineae bacterium]|nr:ABC transporter permease [Anaerolineae bacterium]
MRLTRLLILRSLRARPTRWLLSAFGIVLGVSTILAIGITNRTALLSITRLFETTSGRASLVIVAQDADAKGFPETLLRRVADHPEVDNAVPTLQLFTVLADQVSTGEIGLDFFGTSTGGLLLYGVDAQRDILVRDYQITAGRFLAEDPHAYEVVLVQSFAEDNDIAVGRSIQVVAGGAVESLRVVGLIAKEGAGQLNNGAFGAIPLVTAQRLYDRDGKVDQIDLVVKSSSASGPRLARLKDELQAHVGADYAVVYPAAQGQRMTQMLGNYQIGLNFLSGIALFVGAFLIFNSFSMNVVERTHEYGTLRTIGMTRSQVTRQVLIEAVGLGVVGSGVGTGLGILLARGLTSAMALMINQDLSRVEVQADIVVFGSAIGILVAVIAAVVPAVQAGRISPLEALRVRGARREGWIIRKGWLPGSVLLAISTAVLVANPFPYDVQFRAGSLVVFASFAGGALMIPVTVAAWERLLRPAAGWLYGGSGRLGSANLQRARARTTLTVAALMIGVAMMVIVWAMTDSFKGDLDVWLQGYVGGDLYVTSSLPMGKEVWKRLEAVPGVAAVTPVRYFEVDWVKPEGDVEKITFMAVDPASHAQVTSFVYTEAVPDEVGALRQLAGGDTVFLSSVLAERAGVHAGDEITLVTRTGRRRFAVAAVVLDYYNQGLVVEGSWSDMGRHFRQSGANAFMVKVEPQTDVAQVQERIERTSRSRDQLIIASNASLLERVNGLMRQAFGMFDVLALISMLVGFFGITNTIAMNVSERTREIGMLRCVGMTRLQIVAMILAEAALMGTIGGLLGLVFGVVLSRVFMLAMTAMSGYRLTYILAMYRVVAAVVVSIFVSQLAALFPALRAARSRILDAIHYE